MPRRTKAEIEEEKQVADAAQKASYGFQINIYNLGKVSDASLKAYREGKRGQELVDTVIEFIKTL